MFVDQFLRSSLCSIVVLTLPPARTVPQWRFRLQSPTNKQALKKTNSNLTQEKIEENFLCTGILYYLLDSLPLPQRSSEKERGLFFSLLNLSEIRFIARFFLRNRYSRASRLAL